MAIAVADTGSNTEENIERAAKALGRSAPRRKVFEALYFHKKKLKTVQEIADATGLDRKAVLTHGKHLVSSGLCDQSSADGDTAYTTDPFYQHHKRRILALVDNPSKLKTMVTKRRPEVSARPSFFRPEGKPRKRSPAPSTKALRIAYLITNPELGAALNTVQEAKQVIKAINSSALAEKIELRPLLAPSFDDLIDLLNRFKPHVVHFSGHGGDESLLFDNENIGDVGGTSLDFDTIRELLDAVHFKPKGLVLMACDTVSGASKFLDHTDFVVAMSDSIDDNAASDFSVRFYKSVGDGVALDKAVKQGKVSIKAKGYKDSELPTLIVKRSDVETSPLIT